MQERSRIVGAVVVVLLLVAIGWGAYRFFAGRRNNADENAGSPSATVTITEEQRLEQEMGLDIPDEGERTPLRDVSGGEGLAIARRIENGEGKDVVINANLPEPAMGSFYEAWLIRGEQFLSLGEMRLTKSGYLIEVTETQDLNGYDRVLISLETKRDNTVEKRVLEGEF